MEFDPNPDIEKETVFPPCHCEHLKGACLHAEVSACGRQDKQALRHAGVAISLKKTGLLRFTRNDDSLNLDLGSIKDHF